MELGEIAGALGSVLSGGLTGVVGAGLSRVADFKLEKLRMEHKRETAVLDLRQTQAEAAMSAGLAEVEVEGKVEAAAYDALSTSHQADSAKYLDKAKGTVSGFFMGLVDFVRGMTRPAITYYTIGLTSWIAFELFGLMQKLEGAVDPDYAQSLLMQVVQMVLYLTAVCVTWWFGARPKAVSV